MQWPTMACQHAGSLRANASRRARHHAHAAMEQLATTAVVTRQSWTPEAKAAHARPVGWVAPGPQPVGVLGRPELVPGEGEELSYLTGDWRLFQLCSGHRRVRGAGMLLCIDVQPCCILQPVSRAVRMVDAQCIAKPC